MVPARAASVLFQPKQDIRFHAGGKTGRGYLQGHSDVAGLFGFSHTTTTVRCVS